MRHFMHSTTLLVSAVAHKYTSLAWLDVLGFGLAKD